MSFRRNMIAATLIAAAGALVAAPAGAQVATPPDSTANRLPPIVTTAEREGLLGRIWTMQEKRREVIELERGNRQLRHELAGYDRKIVALEQRLDSLQVQEARMKLRIRAIDSATAATRAERLELEARLKAMERRMARGGSGG